MKILMLHGFAQSGSIFQRKLRRLQHVLEEAFPDVVLYYPAGPVPLRSDELVPKRIDSHLSSRCTSADDLRIDSREETDTYAWFQIHDENLPPHGLTQSLTEIANILIRHGPFDGVVGFSQGGLIAAFVASLLEGRRRHEAFERAKLQSSSSFPFPESFADIQHPPLKFGVTYAALMATNQAYRAFYHDPYVQTPFAHFHGQWDTFVSLEMVRAMELAHIGGPLSRRILHPGAHIVPTDKQYLQSLIEFLGQTTSTSPEQWDFNLPKPDHMSTRTPRN